jgi:hypothetical protein
MKSESDPEEPVKIRLDEFSLSPLAGRGDQL